MKMKIIIMLHVTRANSMWSGAIYIYYIYNIHTPYTVIRVAMPGRPLNFVLCIYIVILSPQDEHTDCCGAREREECVSERGESRSAGVFANGALLLRCKTRTRRRRENGRISRLAKTRISATGKGWGRRKTGKK